MTRENFSYHGNDDYLRVSAASGEGDALQRMLRQPLSSATSTVMLAESHGAAVKHQWPFEYSCQDGGGSRQLQEVAAEIFIFFRYVNRHGGAISTVAAGRAVLPRMQQ